MLRTARGFLYKAGRRIASLPQVINLPQVTNLPHMASKQLHNLE
jgi:hypothetical protein